MSHRDGDSLRHSRTCSCVCRRDDFLDVLRAMPLDELTRALNSLTHQERTVLDFLVRGECNKDICRQLDIEITTAKAHTSRIFKKLGVKNRVQAAVFGLWASLLSRVDGEAAAASFAADENTAKAHAATKPEFQTLA